MLRSDGRRRSFRSRPSLPVLQKADNDGEPVFQQAGLIYRAPAIIYESQDRGWRSVDWEEGRHPYLLSTRFAM